MGKQDIYIKNKNIVDTSIGDEGNALRNHFNIPYEDEDEDYNDIIDVSNTRIYEPIASIDDALRVLNEAKEKGANFVAMWSHEDHQEIRIEAFIIQQLTPEEIVEYKNKLEQEKLALQEKKLKQELAEFERLKQKFGK